jgi:4,4'-diaponeurosporenoate glycosyltransferase
MDFTDLAVQTTFWILGFILLFRIPRCKSVSGFVSRPSLSIIIPARNEEKALPILLASLRKQKYAQKEVIVVVDQSEDKTLEVAEKGGATVIQSQPVPKGWLGKPWACYQGARVAQGEILIFLDADTFIEEDGLERIAQTYMKRDNVVTIQPYHKTRQFYEQLSAFFNIITMGAMGSFTIMGDFVQPIGLFGPCVVMRRKHYFRSGGHREVKGEVLDDLALGEKLRKQKIRISCYGGKGTISFRMYPNGIGELIDGWSKGFATGALKTYVPILLVIIAWIGGCINATRYLIEAAFDISAISISVWATAYLGYAFQIYWMLFRIGKFKFYTALFYPLPLLFFLALFIHSFFLVFIIKRVQWKGRKIYLNGGQHYTVTSYNTNNDRD